jgi:outer membrane protein assembly factor BamB
MLVLTALDDGKLYTIAYSRSDGKERWRAAAPANELEAYHKTEGSPAASTPVTDGERIVSYFGSCGLVCYDLAGKELWRVEMPPAKTLGDFGTGVSPILADGLVILLRDEFTSPKIMAVDVMTHEIKWEKKRASQASYCTPVVWSTPAGKQVAAPGMGQMTGYDLRTGDEKWYVVGMPSALCASPVTADGELYFAGWSPGDPADSEFKMPTYDDILKPVDANGDGVMSKEESLKSEMKDFFDNNDRDKNGMLTRAEWDETVKFMSGSKNSAFALRPGGSGNVTDTHVRWQKTRGLPYVSSALVYRGQHVMVKDGGIVTAYDTKTGDEIYTKRAIAAGKYYASPVAASGRIYFTSLDDGVVTVLAAGTPAAQVVAENPPLGERVAATPAIADDTIYIRTAGHLYAFAEKK